MTEFVLPELIVANQGINYNPALSVAINKALRTRNEEEYQVALKEATKIAIGYERVTLYDSKNYGESSFLSGMPLFQPLKLNAQEGIEELVLESAVTEWDRSKNIVSTNNQGLDGSVDEFINNGDYMINVAGILCYPGARYPLDQVLHFHKFMDLKKAVKITHEALNALGIYEIVMLSHKCNKTSHINCQSYSFTAKQSKPIELVSQQQPNSDLF